MGKNIKAVSKFFVQILVFNIALKMNDIME